MLQTLQVCSLNCQGSPLPYLLSFLFFQVLAKERADFLCIPLIGLKYLTIPKGNVFIFYCYQIYISIRVTVSIFINSIFNCNLEFRKVLMFHPCINKVKSIKSINQSINLNECAPFFFNSFLTPTYQQFFFLIFCPNVRVKLGLSFMKLSPIVVGLKYKHVPLTTVCI